jgi:MFS family permease
MTTELLIPTLLVSLAWYLSISITTYRLAAIGGDPHAMRAFRPVTNVTMLFEIAGKSRRNSRWTMLLLLGVPVVGSVMFATLGGALMARTGRRRITGFILALPPLALLGLPLIAYSARTMEPGGA